LITSKDDLAQIQRVMNGISLLRKKSKKIGGKNFDTQKLQMPNSKSKKQVAIPFRWIGGKQEVEFPLKIVSTASWDPKVKKEAQTTIFDYY
jgi:hypothetical protein